MPSVEQRASQLIAEFSSLQEELAHPASSPQTGLAIPKLPLEQARVLKSAVDKFRLFLWAYLDSWSSKEEAQSKLNSIRVDCACDMLAAIYREFGEHGIPDTPGVERLSLEVGRLAELVRR